MPVVTKYICDGCGKEKGETNHWFKVCVYEFNGEIAVYSWDRQVLGEFRCGEACVMKAISAWMQERKEQDTETGKG